MKAGDKYIVEIEQVFRYGEESDDIAAGIKDLNLLLLKSDLDKLEKYKNEYCEGWNDAILGINNEKCITYLQETGWLKKHDKALMEGKTSDTLKAYSQGFKDGFAQAKELQ